MRREEMRLMNYVDWAVDIWNRFVPEGTPVILLADDGSEWRTKTRSAAWSIGSDAVVKVEGKTGGYLITRLTPVKEGSSR